MLKFRPWLLLPVAESIDVLETLGRTDPDVLIRRRNERTFSLLEPDERVPGDIGIDSDCHRRISVWFSGPVLGLMGTDFLRTKSGDTDSWGWIDSSCIEGDLEGMDKLGVFAMPVE